MKGDKRRAQKHNSQSYKEKSGFIWKAQNTVEEYSEEEKQLSGGLRSIISRKTTAAKERQLGGAEGGGQWKVYSS